MSTISDKISVKKPVIPEQTNVPLDARTVCDSVEDFPNIELPYLGMIVFTKSDGKYWKITELKEKQIGFISVANAQIAKYEEFGVSGGGGTGTVPDFTAGEGIKIENGKISCTVSYGAGEGLKLEGQNFRIDPGKVALKSDLKSYSGSENIAIGSDGKIDVTDKVALKSDIKTYTAGNGISISDDNGISIKGVQHFDKPQDGFIGLYTDADGLHFTTNLIVTKEELSEQLGDINSILDEINGEVI